MNNISAAIETKRSLKLHNNDQHPVGQMKRKIQACFPEYEIYDDLSEVVTLSQNFDSLLFPADHPARSATDTYYVDAGRVLRTHTSAHQNDLLRAGNKRFLVTGDVYRKDTIDRTHYPVFHQMEGVKLLPAGSDALQDLKDTLRGLLDELFPGRPCRFLDDYFPFTEPSIQAEVWYNEDWVEVLGAGVIHTQILRNCGIEGTGWAFGLGIDRLLLSYCSVPDIRYLWLDDERFLGQFDGGLATFQPYSKYPPVRKDVSFWVEGYEENEEGLWNRHNDFCELARETGGDLIEEISLVDRYARDQRVSLMYRIVYRSYDRTLAHGEVNRIQEHIRKELSRRMRVVLR